MGFIFQWLSGQHSKWRQRVGANYPGPTLARNQISPAVERLQEGRSPRPRASSGRQESLLGPTDPSQFDKVLLTSPKCQGRPRVSARIECSWRHLGEDRQELSGNVPEPWGRILHTLRPSQPGMSNETAAGPGGGKQKLAAQSQLP